MHSTGTYRTTRAGQSVLLAGLIALFAFPSLAFASGHKRHHAVGRPARVKIAAISPEILGGTGTSTCTLPTFNPALYLQRCVEAETIATPSATSGTANSSAAGSSDCSQPAFDPWLYAENCQAGTATSNSATQATSVNSPGNATPAPAATADNQTTATNSNSNSCATDTNDPWQRSQAC
jgi:hypothetical protein